MRKLRTFVSLCLLLAATTTFASPAVPQQRDGGETPPLCLPSDPNCKP